MATRAHADKLDDVREQARLYGLFRTLASSSSPNAVRKYQVECRQIVLGIQPGFSLGVSRVRRLFSSHPRAEVHYPCSIGRNIRLKRAAGIWSLLLIGITVCLISATLGSACAQGPSQGSLGSRAIAITPDAEMILRDDGGVVGFSDDERASQFKSVSIDGLQDIVAVSGDSLEHSSRNEKAVWIALRRDGTVYQWGRVCDKGCRYLRASKVHELKNIVAINSFSGTHFAVDRDGQLWGWGVDPGCLTGTPLNWPARPGLISVPIQIPLPVAVRSVAAASNYSIAIDQDGAVWAWGFGNRKGSSPHPVGAQPVQLGAFTFWKVIGLPAARSATILKGRGPSFIVADNDELWSWGSVNPTAFDALDVLRPHKIDEPCLISSIAAGISLHVICRDGSVYRTCLECATAQAQEKVAFLSNVQALAEDETTGEARVIDYSGVLRLADFSSSTAIKLTP